MALRAPAPLRCGGCIGARRVGAAASRAALHARAPAARPAAAAGLCCAALRSATVPRQALASAPQPTLRRCRRGAAPVRASQDSGGADGEQAPPSYQTAALTVGAAALFGAGLYALKGTDAGSEFFAGYLLEQSLSVDNLFVFVLLFGYFKVPKQYEPKVLEYGILGAAGLRAVFILLGAAVLERFRPVLLFFAAILLVSSAKMLLGGDADEEDDVESNAVVGLVRRLLPVAPDYDGDRFWTEVEGVRTATPLLLVLVVIELSDLVFAVDSIPAVFGVTTDPFIVYTSNMFAIASLRSLFPLVAGAMGELKYLEKAVSLVLGFIGAKMIADFAGYHVSTGVSLAVVASALSAGVGLSLALPEKELPEKEE